MSIKEVGDLLQQATEKELRPYSTYDFGRLKDPQNVSVIIENENQARDLVVQLRPHLPPGYVIFVGTTKWYGKEQHEGVELVVGKGESPFDILRLARTDAVNYDMETEDLIRRLQELQARHRIQMQIFQAESDTIWFDLNDGPEDLSAFCKDLYDFCPDIVDQGVGSLDELELFVDAMRQVYLWWD